MNKIYHKFNIFDVCEVCEVTRKKISKVGDGFNSKLLGRFKYHYAAKGSDNYQQEFINCIKNNHE